MFPTLGEPVPPLFGLLGQFALNERVVKVFKYQPGGG
jgi:hypothetical protein